MTMERLGSIVKSALPTISQETLTSVVQCLVDCGVEEERDLVYIQEKDLVGILRPVQCRKLLSVFAALDDAPYSPTVLPRTDAINASPKKSRNSFPPSLESSFVEQSFTRTPQESLMPQMCVSEKSEPIDSESSVKVLVNSDIIAPTSSGLETIISDSAKLENSEVVYSEVATSTSTKVEEKSQEAQNSEPNISLTMNWQSEIPESTNVRNELRQTSENVCLRGSTKTADDRVKEYRQSVISVIFRDALPDSLDWSDTESLEGSDVEEDIFEDEMIKDTTPLLKEAKVTPFMIAAKLMMSEHNYLEHLELLYTNFYTQLKTENAKSPFMEPDSINRIFSNIENIYLFHKTFVLPQLEDRVKNWYQFPQLSDILRNNVPFLRIYFDYIQNFPQAMNLLQSLNRASPRFIEFVDKIMNQSNCERISLGDLLKEPTERLHGYVKLIKEYVSVLSRDSIEFNQAAEALNLVSKIAHNSSEAMKKQESFLALFVLSTKLTGVPQDFITPTRQMIGGGPIYEICGKGREKVLRHLLLFNDLILVCSYDIATDKYAVWAYIEMDGIEMKILGSSFELTNEMVRCELMEDESPAATIGWMQKLDSAIKDYEAKKLQRLSHCITFNSTSLQSLDMNERPESYYGKIRPVWVPDYVATTCMVCLEKFTVVNRRHHCRSCGKLICRSCCKKAPIEYKNSKKRLVCPGCYLVIMNNLEQVQTPQHNSDSEATKPTPNSRINHKGSFISSILPSARKRGAKSSEAIVESAGRESPSEPHNEAPMEYLQPSPQLPPRDVSGHQTVDEDEKDECPYENINIPSALSILESSNDSTVELLMPKTDYNESNA